MARRARGRRGKEPTLSNVPTARAQRAGLAADARCARLGHPARHDRGYDTACARRHRRRHPRPAPRRASARRRGAALDRYGADQLPALWLLWPVRHHRLARAHLRRERSAAQWRMADECVSGPVWPWMARQPAPSVPAIFFDFDATLRAKNGSGGWQAQRAKRAAAAAGRRGQRTSWLSQRRLRHPPRGHSTAPHARSSASSLL